MNLTRQELAEHLGIKRNSLATMLSAGQLVKPDVRGGRDALWSLEAVEAWQAARPGRGARKSTPPLERFMAKVKADDATGCWLWQGHVCKVTGYGAFAISREKRGPAHRRGYELLVGPITDDLTLDHLCRNRVCVNPAHLEPVTQRENNLRAPESVAALNVAKTHCPKGHEYTPENTRASRETGRACRECGRASWRDWYQRRKASA